MSSIKDVVMALGAAILSFVPRSARQGLFAAVIGSNP
jgi:hypothetical protein